MLQNHHPSDIIFLQGMGMLNSTVYFIQEATMTTEITATQRLLTHFSTIQDNKKLNDAEKEKLKTTLHIAITHHLNSGEKLWTTGKFIKPTFAHKPLIH
jgi:hypothetical protein